MDQQRELKKRDALFLAPHGDSKSENAVHEYLTHIFTYHQADGEQRQRYHKINQAAYDFANTIMHQCPPSADRSEAIRLIRMARMTANASIATNGDA